MAGSIPPAPAYHAMTQSLRKSWCVKSLRSNLSSASGVGSAIMTTDGIAYAVYMCDTHCEYSQASQKLGLYRVGELKSFSSYIIFLLFIPFPLR